MRAVQTRMVAPTLPGRIGRLATRVRGPVITALIVLLLWEGLTRLFGVASYLLPPPSEVFAQYATRWPRILEGLRYTGVEIVLGYAIAVVTSLALAVAIAYSSFIERHIYPVIVTFTIIPKIAIAPLFIIWFGFGLMPKLLLVFLLSFFPMLVNDIAGFRSVNPEIMDFARSTGASGFKLFRKIRLPQALPSIFTGARVGAINATTGAVVGEFVASDKGLGYLLLEYNGNLDTAAMFATILVLCAIGVALYYAVEWLERVTIPWHVSQRRDELTANS